MVSHDSFDSTTSTIQTVINALVRDELLGHTDKDIKAPKYPHNDHRQMEAFKKLAHLTRCCYRKVIRVLEIFAKVRIEIFKNFLEVIRYFVKVLFSIDIIIIV
uniref:Uncharacterized protein n=1 Tax=Solanum lycopersicum TaxID=4081 RepID=A0A3Q7JB60_SOLLC